MSQADDSQKDERRRLEDLRAEGERLQALQREHEARLQQSLTEAIVREQTWTRLASESPDDPRVRATRDAWRTLRRSLEDV